MLKVDRACRCFAIGLMLTSSNVAHSQVVAGSEIVGRWASPDFTDVFRGLRRKETVTDTLATRTTIVFRKDRTWLAYTSFRSRSNGQWNGTTRINGAGAWRQNGDTLWLAEENKWYEGVITYTADGEVTVRDTVMTLPEPADAAWRSYRATMQDQRLSVGRFGATETTAGSGPFVCPVNFSDTQRSKVALDYYLVCPGVYDRRTAPNSSD